MPNLIGPSQPETMGNPWATPQGPLSQGTNPIQQDQSQMQGMMDQLSKGVNQENQWFQNYQTQAPGMQNNINNLSQQASQYGQASAPYPSFPNAAGAGSQTAGQQAQPQATPTYGFSPWSLQGEAMAR